MVGFIILQSEKICEYCHSDSMNISNVCLLNLDQNSKKSENIIPSPLMSLCNDFDVMAESP